MHIFLTLLALAGPMMVFGSAENRGHAFGNLGGFAASGNVQHFSFVGETVASAGVSSGSTVAQAGFIFMRMDRAGPTLVSVERVTPATVIIDGTTDIVFRLTFSEAISTPVTSDFLVTTTGTAAGSIKSVAVGGNATEWLVTVEALSGDGDIGVGIAP